MSGVIRWEEPPPHGNAGQPRSTKWAAIAEELRQHPGEWALIVEGGLLGSIGGAVHRINTGKRLVAFRPAGHFEARSVKRTDGIGDLYARYIGEKPP